MSELKEGWEKENLEKAKKELNEHFKRKKEEEMFKEMLREFERFSRPTQLHVGTDWDTEDSDFDKLNNDSIWEDITDSNNNKEKGSE